VINPVNAEWNAENDQNKNIVFDSKGWNVVGRGDVEFKESIVLIKNCYITFAKQQWQNHEIQFKARAPKNADQVQIWAGFHFQDRDTRYAVGLRGGNSDDLYLCRYAPDGQNKMLALEPLDFHPEPGIWYKFIIDVWDGKIYVFLNDEKSPRLIVTDEFPLKSGKVILGGGWIETEFKDVLVHPLEKTRIEILNNNHKKNVWQWDSKEKETIRKNQRNNYEIIKISALKDTRTEILLDGNWLFKPGYEISSSQHPYSLKDGDKSWHILQVPGFWNPVRNWLHLQDSKLPHRGSGVSDNYRESELNRCRAYTFDAEKTNRGWYRKWIDLPLNFQNKKFVLHFDAVSKVADVWVNGKYIGGHVGMFGDFELDITDAVKPGKNLIAVFVQVRKYEKSEDAAVVVGRAVSMDITNDMLNSLPHGMFQGNEGGIWQPVKLIVTNPTYINDVFAKVRTDGGDFEISVNNENHSFLKVGIQIEIRSENENELLFLSSLKLISAEKNQTTNTTITVDSITPKLWTPENPNLYVLSTKLYLDEKLIDQVKTNIGFRTFEANGNRFLLNGKPYWLRGANHPPVGIAPNNSTLANTFMKLMNESNQMVTRTTCCPSTEPWLNAADRHGVGISFEGTWPWLMIDKMPARELLDIWRQEMLSLVRKFRNHPSIFIWTMNNEMYFTMFNHNKPKKLRIEKWKFLSDVIKEIRRLDPTRPISGDSGYSRVQEDYDLVLAPNNIDDGDIDDRHIYPGWYNRDFFQFINGEWAKRIYWSPGANPDRPFFSQEASTGYPNNDTGHPTRKYLFGHYVPQALVGDWAYEDKDPKYFLQRHAFLSKELAEVIRRTSPESAGLLLFANLCWYRNVMDAEKIEAYPVVEKVKNAFEPVLVSLELFGRNFYAGKSISPRICIVNDMVDGEKINNGLVEWQIIFKDKILQKGTIEVGEVHHNKRRWIETNITFPEKLPAQKVNCLIRLKLVDNGQEISLNEYDIILSDPHWLKVDESINKSKIGVFDLSGETISLLEKIGIELIELKDLTRIRLEKLDLLIVANIDQNPEVPYNWEDVKNIAANGPPVLLIHPGEHLKWLLPNMVESLYHRTGRMVNMRIPEHQAFDGIEPLELSWWQSDGRNIPISCRRSYRFKIKEDVEELCTYLRPHVYLSNPKEQLREMSGSPFVEIKVGDGKIIACEMEVNAGLKDPVAARLLLNLVEMLVEEK